jgi:RNA polymerase sigma factor (TIGR02999 family)
MLVSPWTSSTKGLLYSRRYATIEEPHVRKWGFWWGFAVTEPAPKEVTRILAAINGGDRQARDELMGLAYDHLRRLAQKKMADEPPGHTLQATALVHEAYLRLFEDQDAGWENRRHFYGAASEAMRRILVERARKYQRKKHGGGRRRVPLDDAPIECELEPDELIALDEAMKRLAGQDRRMYEVVMLRYFSGLEIEQIARALDVSPSTVDREWRCARLWLYEQVTGEQSGGGGA